MVSEMMVHDRTSMWTSIVKNIANVHAWYRNAGKCRTKNVSK
jgi:hypothetical protein